MKLVSLNIEANLHYDRVLSFLKESGADVICLQEVLEDDFEFLKKELGCDGIWKPRGHSLPFIPRYSAIHKKRYGSAIFSKVLKNKGSIFYWGSEDKLEIPYEETLNHGEEIRSYPLVWADIEGEGGEVYRCVATHFPVTNKGESSPHQLEVLLPFFKELDTLGDFILCGDFNAPRGNKTFSEIAARYKDVIPKEYETSIDQNLHRNKGIMFMVDGLFLTQKYVAENVMLVDGLSDHMAIVADIRKEE